MQQNRQRIFAIGLIAAAVEIGADRRQIADRSVRKAELFPEIAAVFLFPLPQQKIPDDEGRAENCDPLADELQQGSLWFPRNRRHETRASRDKRYSRLRHWPEPSNPPRSSSRRPANHR